VSDGVDYL